MLQLAFASRQKTKNSFVCTFMLSTGLVGFTRVFGNRRSWEPRRAQPSPAQASRAAPSPAQPGPAWPSPARPGPTQPSPGLAQLSPAHQRALISSFEALPPEQQKVSPQPEIRVFKRDDAKDEVLILACDGVFHGWLG